MRVHVYPAADGWRWNCRASNGRIIAESGEGYTTRAGCVKTARKVFKFTTQKVEMHIDNPDGSFNRSEWLR